MVYNLEKLKSSGSDFRPGVGCTVVNSVALRVVEYSGVRVCKWGGSKE